MPAQILATKLFVPMGKRWTVSRPRLLSRLDDALRDGLRFVLVSAPAGYGKTTLVAEWIQRRRAESGAAFAWVSLDAADNDPVRFWSYVIAAMQRALGDGDGTGKAALEVLEHDPDALAQALERLLNDLAALAESLVLVLDDYHLITEPLINESMAMFLERQPQTLLLVIVSRADPALPVSRLRVRGEMLEIRPPDLAFRQQETSQFFQQTFPQPVGLTEADLALLEKRTEGWVAGLQLAALALQRSRPWQVNSSAPSQPLEPQKFIEQFNEHHHLLVDYLMDEVLRYLPEPTQAFLLKTSVLEKMCGPLCDAVLDDPPDAAVEPSAVMLEQLERANLFLVPLDEERKWYRYHALFGGLLRARLAAQHPDLLPLLHQRAAQWYEQNGSPLDAVQHALATHDFSLAAGTIQRLLRSFVNWGGGMYATALRWLRALPAEILENNLNLGLYTCIVLYASGMIEAGEALLTRIERAVAALDPLDANTSFLTGYTAAIRALYANITGKPVQAIAYAEKALQRLSGSPITPWTAARMALGRAHLLTGNVQQAIAIHTQTLQKVRADGVAYLAMNLSFLLAEAHIAAGRLGEAREVCQEALRQWDSTQNEGRNAIVSTLELTLARIDYEQNHLQEAAAHATTALELSQRGGITDDFGGGRVLMAQIALALGNQAAARQVLAEAVAYAKRERSPMYISLYAAHQARQHLAVGQLAEAEDWAGEAQLPAGGEWLADYETLTLARVRLAQGRGEEVLEPVTTVLSQARAAGRGKTQVEALALLAMVYQALGQAENASQHLFQALRLGLPEGYARTFIDLGTSMYALLQNTSTDTRADATLLAYRDRLLQQFREALINTPADDQPALRAQPLVETLTDRELEVLQRLASGASNQEIAEQLVVSVGTVKAHLAHIMGKLGAKNRTETVVFARKLGLLP